MKAVRCRVTLLEPAILTSLEGDANSATSFPYLPGSFIRGVAIAKYQAQHGLQELDPLHPDHRRLFFDGTTRFLNGYPLVHQVRTLPIPSSWYTPKEDPSQVYDFALEEEEDSEEQWQAVNHQFCSLEEDQAHWIDPSLRSFIHTARTRRYGRAMPADKVQDAPGQRPGAVFRYVALAERQTFETVVLCDRDGDAAELQGLLNGEAFIGRARSGGYGRVELKADILDQWSETPQPAQPGESLVITLLSPALVRNPQGQTVTDAQAITWHLRQLLGIDLRCQKAFLRGAIVGGFNGKWGLPLPQALAVGMGNVLVYQPETLPPQGLQRLLEQGIGERRVDGFGRVAVNWQRHARLNLHGYDPVSLPGVSLAQGSEAHAVAQLMSERLLRQRLDHYLVREAVDIKVDLPPNQAQLSRLRTVIHNALLHPVPGTGEPDTRRVREFIQGIQERDAARNQFARSRVGSEPLLEWIEGYLSDNPPVRNLLNNAPTPPSIGGVQAQMSPATRLQFALRYIDAVLALAQKQARRRDGGG